MYKAKRLGDRYGAEQHIHEVVPFCFGRVVEAFNTAIGGFEPVATAYLGPKPVSGSAVWFKISPIWTMETSFCVATGSIDTEFTPRFSCCRRLISACRPGLGAPVRTTFHPGSRSKPWFRRSSPPIGVQSGLQLQALSSGISTPGLHISPGMCIFYLLFASGPLILTPLIYYVDISSFYVSLSFTLNSGG